MVFPLPTPPETDAGNDYIDVHDDFMVGDAFVRLDPLGHALAAACATLRAGIWQLRDIEVKLDIPQPQGVAAKMDSPVGSTGLPPSAPPAQEPIRPETPGTGNGYVTCASVARLVALLWEEEVPAPNPEIPKTTLARLWHYQGEISRLVRQHSLSYL